MNDGFSAPRLTATQRRVFDELLAVGAARPTAPPGLADELRQTIADGVADLAPAWPDGPLYLTKGSIASVLACEGRYLAEQEGPPAGATPPPVAAGIVTHRAIQLAHTHPGRPVEEYVRAAALGAAGENAEFAALWDDGIAAQSDVLAGAVSRVTAFLDSWPPLDAAWSPRFEESLAARAGLIRLHARPDLILGRPRPDGRRTMLLVDLKSGRLREEHHQEAQLYALVCTLRHGLPPWRSAVFSLADGEWTDPRVSPDSLAAAARRVVAAARAAVQLKTESRPAALSPGEWCRRCPRSPACPAAAPGGGPRPAPSAEGPPRPPVPARQPFPEAAPDARDDPYALPDPATPQAARGAG
ncbi:PD-(D/E)XK nuclease family protein [Bailinhaonella thermotolerans]|nr:PD-(D/E)XK nuclease family protein [Bailinhaonella thermotolerans]